MWPANDGIMFRSIFLERFPYRGKQKRNIGIGETESKE